MRSRADRPRAGSSSRLRVFVIAAVASLCIGAGSTVSSATGSADRPPPGGQTNLPAPTPVPTEQVTFQEAVDRALKNNTSVAIAAAGILRAEGLLRQARSATLLQINGGVTVTTLNRIVEFSGLTVVPRTQLSASVGVDMPILAAAAWARRTQAEDQTEVAKLSVADVRRQIAVSAADAYLSVIGLRRVLEAQVRARDVAKAHFDLASQLEQKGSGSRLNALRAQQQVSTSEGLVEVASLALYRSQEALGVVMVADGPVDAGAEPAFDITAETMRGPATASDLLPLRTDLKLFAAETTAADRVVRDSSKDWWPTVDTLFQPATIRPANIFTPSTTWQLFFRGNIPIFDSGGRTGLKVERQSQLDTARATLAGAETLATSEVRTAREAVLSGERSLTSARAAADQAEQVVNITNIAFRAGGATNIEVIDAQRSARDAETAVAVAEDTLRRAKLELLQAVGRFP